MVIDKLFAAVIILVLLGLTYAAVLAIAKMMSDAGPVGFITAGALGIAIWKWRKSSVD